MDKDEPAQPHNKVHGIIEDIAYFGSHSVYHVRLVSGALMLVNAFNAQRWAAEALTWNDHVWLSWDELSGVVLSS